MRHDAPRKRVHKLRYGEVSIRDRGRLPHWEAEGATYFVTFRLADAFPKSVLRSYEFERADIIKVAEQQRRPLTTSEHKRLDELFSERISDYLDRGAGACHLRRPELARMVADALRFFHSERYRLLAWCVMPNHVHVVIAPFTGYGLAEILHWWKSFTAKRANTLLRLAGPFWEREYYDHLVRDEEDLARIIDYVRQNPERAGLKNWEWVRVDPALSSL
ncbi:MAG: transposase [Acidobacteria bacterium]|nr:transposase [Acidobacteriota bacterium]